MPLYGLPALEDEARLRDLRRRFIHLATGEGDYEQPAESQRLAETLAARGIPHQLDLWGRDFAHGWGSWHQMLPRTLAPHI